MKTEMNILAAVLALGSGPAVAHDPLMWGGNEIHIMLDAAGTGGSMGMFSVTTRGPGGPGMHVHEDADEAFYVIEGTADFALDGARTKVPEGEAVFVPKGAEHTFRVTDAGGGKLLVIVAPGGFEGFFQAMVAEGLEVPADMARINEVSRGFGQIFTGPPLPAD